MAKVTVTVEGLEALKAAVQRCPDDARRHLSDVVQATAFSVAQRAKALAPVDTGALKASIASTSRGLSGRVGLSGGMVRGKRPDIYWRFVEFGTVRTPARPLFRAATEAESSTFEKRLRDASAKIERNLGGSGSGGGLL